MTVNLSQLNSETATIANTDRVADIKEMVQKNLELTEKVLELTRKLDSHRKWQQFYGVLKVFIFVVPVVLSIMYLPSLLEKAFEPYNELLNMGGQKSIIPQNASELLKTIKGK